MIKSLDYLSRNCVIWVSRAITDSKARVMGMQFRVIYVGSKFPTDRVTIGGDSNLDLFRINDNTKF